MAEQVDCIVIGAGVVGLAVAREFALAGREVVVLERAGLIGSETSSRNSEVIHAGIYYPSGSLKAKLCVLGKQMLYEYCELHQIPYSRCGKIIVATNEAQRETLSGYQAQANANGVGPLRSLSARDIVELEPEVSAFAGLMSETTGILDTHAFMLSLQGEIQAHGGTIAFNTEVERLRLDSGSILVQTPMLELRSDHVINCAGLWAPDLARHLDDQAPEAFYARGHYYTYSGRPPFGRLVYPVAEAGGLGVHVTLDLAGQVKFGPDIRWIKEVDYDFDDSHRGDFIAAIRRYYPGLDEGRLQPGYTGIRPKIAGPGEGNSDFRIDTPAEHGVPGLVNLLGIDSPGLTSSLAIAQCVREALHA
ncbi:MAG: NAD(P)/FAD-dependent oxidoreductase [Pseudomonadales bacterium]|nr:NAD(P)/FAD-dependent oxidoreductase [Pseudomonadales bacterium]MDP6472884.1 NAD(P)/FAD-dependent oxidoreductase [Pseudomonadales bacterium]MDP6826359.1 NAD(P)/FAD-dependent oxidoreductase [Pseudomonadales bacterium]MDP6973290.1 NAD(P)/FAD-dependent oxidoreductase [Pseudomonadales bacterium]